VVANASIALVSAERLLDFACHFLGVVVLSQVVTLGGFAGAGPLATVRSAAGRGAVAAL
jgi:hypothetical protein